MKKYFLRLQEKAASAKITSEQIASYRKLVIAEMREMGAVESDYSLIHDATISNSIKNKRVPRDVAWAILQ